MQWVKYRQLRGSFALHRRLEQQLAGISNLLVSGLSMKKQNGDKFTVEDFMPHERERAPLVMGDDETDSLDAEYNKPSFQKLN